MTVATIYNLLKKRKLHGPVLVCKNETQPSQLVLNVNRACNFRCEWCYGKDANFSEKANMDIELLYKLVDLASNLKINLVVLIGGEPTIYPKIFDAVKYIKQKNMKCILVSNGYKFADIQFLKYMESVNLDLVSISLKAGNASLYDELGPQDAYDQIKKAIYNLRTSSIKTGYSFTLNKYNIDDLMDIAKLVAPSSSELWIAFCRPNVTKYGKEKDFLYSYKKMATAVVKSYVDMCQIINNKIVVAGCFPLCIWPKSFCRELQVHNCFRQGCQIFSRKNIIFDANGNILLCTHMLDAKLGKYGKEFEDESTFLRFWCGNNLLDTFHGLLKLPYKKCENCPDITICKGGCPLIWI